MQVPHECVARARALRAHPDRHRACTEFVCCAGAQGAQVPPALFWSDWSRKLLLLHLLLYLHLLLLYLHLPHTSVLNVVLFAGNS